AIAAGGNGAVLKSVASGEKAYVMVVDYLPIREKAKGAPFEFVFPSEGVSAGTSAPATSAKKGAASMKNRRTQSSGVKA
ncbi:Fe(3+) ABC transporter substrate-binding protein, partial [Rhizobium leguminosarum]